LKNGLADSTLRPDDLNFMKPAVAVLQTLTTTLLLFQAVPFVLFADAHLPVHAQTTQNPKTEAERLLETGIQQYQAGQTTEALTTFEKALRGFRQTGDRENEWRSLGWMGLVYSRIGQIQQALELHQQALIIAKAINYRSGEGSTLNNIGGIYHRLGQYPKALEFFQQTLAIRKEIGDRSGESTTLNNIGSIYSRLGQYPRALEFYQQSLAIGKEIGDRAGEGATLNNIGFIYDGLGQYPQALEFYQQALAIRKAIGDRSGEGSTLNGIGGIYDRLGQYPQALEFYQRSLAIRKAIGDRAGEGTTLNNIGSIYHRLGQYPRALEFYQQSLAIGKEIGDRSGEGTTLNGIGGIYDRLGQYPKALEFFQQAFAIGKEIGDRSGEGTTLNNIGLIYKSLGQYPKALEFYQQALAIGKEIGDRSGEGTTLNNIGYLLEAQKQPELAIVFLKQSVSTYEQIRGELKLLPKEQQQSYTETVAHTYRRLADLLLQQDRVLEAQQVLDLLKIQELDDYLRDVQKTGQRIEFLQPELEILKRYSALQKTAIEIGSELAELRKLDSKNALTPAQQQRLTQLANLEIEINQQFNAFLESDPIKRLTMELVRVTNNQNLNLEDLVGLQSDLRKLNAVLLYPLILEDRLELVITTPNAPPLRRVVKVKREDLNRTIQQFRSALGQRQDNPQALAQQPYTWLIQPLEADLKQANVNTIIYAPDGQLRYIPLAALHDGNQWLIQKYRIQNITARAVTKLDDVPQPEKRIFAAAFGAKEMTVSVAGESFRFAGLPFAAKEIQSLTQAFPTTVSLLEQNFNRDVLLTRMNSFNLVHLATHGKFLIGKPDNSFLVTGDGKVINLKEIKNLLLGNVDLVVLSACETGIGLTNQANGVEVLGLGYQFQRAGAKATIASLWSIHDGGTQRFMDIFYGLLQQGTPKAAALQQAQIALITGDFTAGGKLRGFRIEPTSNQAPIATSLKHPFYWAPFILIGNGL
jgi:CHAT domain-containing protein/tetratricopeptide (TPR) repeat protein